MLIDTLNLYPTRKSGHMRPSSPLLDSVRDQFEDYDQLAKDFTRVFLNSEQSILLNSHLFDVVFLVGQSKQKIKLIGVRAILGVRSRVFQVNSPNWGDNKRSGATAGLCSNLNEFFLCAMFQEMLYGIQTGFGSPQVPVAELLARPVPTLLSPQNQRQKSSNFLQVSFAQN